MCKVGEFYRFNDKYVVLKKDDINKYLSDRPKHDLDMICRMIRGLRHYEGKKDNSYLVVNTDEPYAPEVARIMTEHGHCAGPDDTGDLIVVPKETPPHG